MLLFRVRQLPEGISYCCQKNYERYLDPFDLAQGRLLLDMTKREANPRRKAAGRSFPCRSESVRSIRRRDGAGQPKTPG